MALKGRDGQRFSHAPQPMHFSTFTTGIFRESALSGSEAAVIGVVTEKKEKLIVVNELEHRCLSPVNGDEIHKVL